MYNQTPASTCMPWKAETSKHLFPLPVEPMYKVGVTLLTWGCPDKHKPGGTLWVKSPCLWLIEAYLPKENCSQSKLSSAFFWGAWKIYTRAFTLIHNLPLDDLWPPQDERGGNKEMTRSVELFSPWRCIHKSGQLDQVSHPWQRVQEPERSVKILQMFLQENISEQWNQEKWFVKEKRKEVALEARNLSDLFLSGESKDKLKRYYQGSQIHENQKEIRISVHSTGLG